MPQNAVSILRVSTKKQLNEGEGIENQRRGNTEYLRRKGYRLVREFVIAETADDREREDFEAAISQIIEHRKEIDVVVFWKVDRISRGGVMSYYTLKGVLAKHGVRIEFATEQIDNSATGELMETLLAGMARFENRLRVERTIGVERILTKEGYWCRPAPTGFRNGRSEGKPILLPTEDAEQWELLCYGLSKQRSGVYTLAEVAEEMRKKGLRTREGNPPGNQTWLNICRSPVYGGLLSGKWTDGELIRAKFDGPLTPEEWMELQRVLNGEKHIAAPAPRQQLHSDFPLRRFLRCPGCDQASRGYNARGRHGTLFAYYDCKMPACRFRVPTDETHEAFVKLLYQVTPAEPLVTLFREVVLRVWEGHLRELEAEQRAGKKSITSLEAEKQSILALMKRSANNPTLLEDLERDYERINRELSLSGLTEKTDLQRYKKEEVVDCCLNFMCRTPVLWQEWPIESQSHVQRLILPAGVNYQVLTGSRTPQLSLLYTAFPASRSQKSRMAPPAWRVTNQLIEEMIGWYKALKMLPFGENTRAA